jgi:hypothetical protein
MSSWNGKATNENGEPLMTREQYATESYDDALSQQDAREYEMYDSPEAQFEPDIPCYWEHAHETFRDTGVENDTLFNFVVDNFKRYEERIAGLQRGDEYWNLYKEQCRTTEMYRSEITGLLGWKSYGKEMNDAIRSMQKAQRELITAHEHDTGELLGTIRKLQQILQLCGTDVVSAAQEEYYQQQEEEE